MIYSRISQKTRIIFVVNSYFFKRVQTGAYLYYRTECI